VRNALERRKGILDFMNIQRHDTVSNLAFEFHVSKKTIFRDISILETKYPIYCLHGRPGGVHMVDGFYLDRKYLSDKQSELLERLLPNLSTEDAETMKSIIKSFAVPKRKIKN